MRHILFLLFILSIGSGCKNEPVSKVASTTEEIIGTADDQSKIIVDQMMNAMGGESKWDELKCASWTFFGIRKLVWDKQNSRVRIENPKDTSIYLIDMIADTGRYSKNGIEILDTTIVNQQIRRGKSIWINDMYWLFMPFKLRDAGVTLAHIGTDTISKGIMTDIISVTFDGVGDTPQNKYHVYVDQSDHLIKQWDFFAKSSQEKPNRSWPWDNYSDFDGLFLSQERSDESGPSQVKVYTEIDEKIFSEF